MYDYINSLPTSETMDIPHLWDDEEIKYYEQITFRNLFIRIKPSLLFEQFIKLLESSEYKKESEYLLKNVFVSKEQFEWAFAIAQSRSYTLRESIYK